MIKVIGEITQVMIFRINIKTNNQLLYIIKLIHMKFLIFIKQIHLILINHMIIVMDFNKVMVIINFPMHKLILSKQLMKIKLLLILMLTFINIIHLIQIMVETQYFKDLHPIKISM